MLMTTVLFAPTAIAPEWPPFPTVQSDHYTVVGGTAETCVQLWMGTLALSPMEWNCPFGSRAPYFTPMVQMQTINFSVAIDPTEGVLGPCVVFLTVPWQSIVSVDHVFWSDTLGFTRVQLLPTGDDGMGWLYLLPGISDVDMYVANTNVEGTPVSLWTGPSPMAGAVASSPAWGGFPDPGVDNMPGFLPTSDDGFGDGIPDPAGSSVLFIPLQMMVTSWNGTDWDLVFGGPFLLPLTTGTAYDIAVAPGDWVDGKNITKTGHPWMNLMDNPGMWDPYEPANELKKWVKYVCAWSFIRYQMAPGVWLDLVYGVSEYKVKDPHLIPDINGDQTVTIADVRIAGRSYDLYDEGIPASSRPGYEPPWWWEDQATTLNPETGMYYGPYPAAWVAVFGCPYTVFADPDFDARADMNNNGHINIYDVRAIAKHYLETIDP